MCYGNKGIDLCDVESPLDTPVLFIVFNRPDTTKQVFEAIRKERPRRLFVAADGPRKDRPDDVDRCQLVRSIVTAVDWECELKTLFRDHNVGCGRGPYSAITWFFENVEEGIILEDDCLPSHEFFLFATQLLNRYRDDSRIMQIGGSNFMDDALKHDEHSYYFSNHNMIWGWATWRRAWKLYDYEMKLYKKVRDGGYLNTCFTSFHELDYFRWIFDKTVANVQQLTWWDYQWEFARRINSGLTIIPQRNLVVNLGIGNDATHTTDPLGAGHDLKFEGLDFPLVHPSFVLADDKRDEFFFKNTFTTGVTRIKAAVKRALPQFILDLRATR